jgi:tetratricopeptide (TPR) repeat protein
MLATMPRRFPLLMLAWAVWLLPGCNEEPREVTTSSDLAYTCYTDGRASTERFRLEKGRQCFLDAVERDPEFSMAWAHLGIVQRQLGDTEAATESVRRAFETRGSASEVEAIWITRLKALFDRDYEAATAAYAELVEKYPNHPWVLRLRAEYAKQNNDYETALACYDRLLEEDPDAVAIHNLKGYLYLSQGNYEQAVLSLQRYAYYAPDQANPHDSLGEAFLYTGRYDEAIREFTTALELDPAFLWSANNLSLALAITGQTNAAVLLLDRYKPAFEERKMTAWWELARSKVALRARRWPEVLDLTAASLATIADMGDQEKLEYELFARYARSIALLEVGNMDGAREALAELALVAQKVRGYGTIAKLERPQQLFELHEAMTLSRFDRADGVPTKGIPRLEASIATASLSPHELAGPTYELAMAYVDADQPETAATVAQRILDVIPTAPELNFVVAKAWANAGNRDLALEHLQTYLDVMRNADDDNEQVQEATALLQRLVPRS